jgi:hypothetical protein
MKMKMKMKMKMSVLRQKNETVSNKGDLNYSRVVAGKRNGCRLVHLQVRVMMRCDVTKTMVDKGYGIPSDEGIALLEALLSLRALKNQGRMPTERT